MSGAALASRRCQPEGQRYQAREGGCLLLSPPGSQARYRPKYTWAGPHCFPGPPGSWDPKAGGQVSRFRPGSRQPQQKPGHQSHYWQGLQGALAPPGQLSLPWGLPTELPGLRERENQGSLLPTTRKAQNPPPCQPIHLFLLRCLPKGKRLLRSFQHRKHR